VVDVAAAKGNNVDPYGLRGDVGVLVIEPRIVLRILVTRSRSSSFEFDSVVVRNGDGVNGRREPFNVIDAAVVNDERVCNDVRGGNECGLNFERI
jgi:hypothetical protein